MKYPNDLLFDIDTLINAAQPSSILLLGEHSADFLGNYVQQRELLGKPCGLTTIDAASIDTLFNLHERYDVAVVAGLLEHLDKQTGGRILSRLRDVLCPQYCIALPMHRTKMDSATDSSWQRNELFAFALHMVADYTTDAGKFGLFKYHIADYKNTPDWLNPDNWANPKMWDKYRW